MDAIECLKDIFNNVNSWLVFAETKNAALVGFDIAILAISDRFLENMTKSSCLGMCLFLFGILFPIISFLPIYNRINIYKKKKGTNLLFFADIATHSEHQYFDMLKKNYINVLSLKGKEKIVRDYILEIVTNSQITVYKLFMFKIGVYFSLGFIIYMVLCNII